MRTVLHIGLHKTATTYLQRRLFAHLDDPGIVVDPAPIADQLGSLFFRLDYGLLQEEEIAIFEKRLAARRAGDRDKLWLISNESLSQNMYLLNFDDHARLAARLFPGAEVVLVLRFQPDWLLSAYKQLVSRGDAQSIEAFLGYRNGTFHPAPPLDLHAKRPPHTFALGLAYDKLVENLWQHFGKANVHVLFYEHFRKDAASVLRTLSAILDIRLKEAAAESLVNRSYSALACTLSARRAVLVRAVGLGWRLDAGTRLRHRIRQRELERYLRDADIAVTVDRSRRNRRTLSELSEWHFWMQEVLDRIVYRDWDLLSAAGLREPLTVHYRAANRRLANLLGRDRVPAVYTG